MNMMNHGGVNQTLICNRIQILLFRDRMIAKARNEYKKRDFLESRVYMMWLDRDRESFFRFKKIPGTPVTDYENGVCEAEETQRIIESEMKRFKDEGCQFLCVFRVKVIYNGDELEYVHTSLKVGEALEEVETELFEVVWFTTPEDVERKYMYPRFELIEW